jgi:hypothetical protein
MFFSPNINHYFIIFVKGVKRMRKMDNLDYYNHEDIHNKFRGLIEFPSISWGKLANILCKDEKMVQKYLNEYYNPEYEYKCEIFNSLNQFKKDIKKQRISDEIEEYKDKVKTCIKTANWKYLWTVLQNLFLESLEWEQVLDIVELIHKGIDEKDIILWYKKGRKILAMTTFGVDYIKSITNK